VSQTRNPAVGSKAKAIFSGDHSVRAHPAESRTTGSTVRTEIRTGKRLPDSVEIEAFPDEVYRESPAVRDYRYIPRDSRTYVVQPGERRIIEQID
jgi:hypothetical protein